MFRARAAFAGPPQAGAIVSALSFFRAWLTDPRRVGAIIPSSEALADAITADLTPASAPVIELGPGTGVFTRSIIARGIPENRLALIEKGSAFVDRLQREFPQACVHHMDATRLRHVDLFDGERAGAIVSGIPLLLMPLKKVVALLDGAFHRLRMDGGFYQFTYGLGSPIPIPVLDRLGLSATRVGGTFANLPPASVYRIRRRPSRTLSIRSPANLATPASANVSVYVTSRSRTAAAITEACGFRYQNFAPSLLRLAD
jgi:phosphatidylethanolamine/phosphatidyl-N-methylethanolamine N-methyltransferase